MVEVRWPRHSQTTRATDALSALRALVAINAARELQYRANFVASVLGAGFWLLTSMFAIGIFYEHTTTIGGWTFWETAVLLGVFNALVGIVEGWLRPGIGSLPDTVRRGTLDLVLTRPVDAQLYLSFRELDLWRVVDVLAGFGLVLFAQHRLGHTVTATTAAIFLVVFGAAVVILYGVWVSLMSLAFWFVAIENLSTVFDALFEAARYPASAYPAALRVVFLFVLPIAWTTTVPASVLVGRASVATVVGAIAVAIGMLVIARLIWRLALRRYTGAGG